MDCGITGVNFVCFSDEKSTENSLQHYKYITKPTEIYFVVTLFSHFN